MIASTYRNDFEAAVKCLYGRFEAFFIVTIAECADMFVHQGPNSTKFLWGPEHLPSLPLLTLRLWQQKRTNLTF